MLGADLAGTRWRRRRAAWLRGTNTRTGARGKLSAGSFAPRQHLGHFAERKIEHIVQQKGSALERRQPLENQKQSNRQILGQFRVTVGSERGRVGYRLRQPRAN